MILTGVIREKLCTDGSWADRLLRVLFWVEAAVLVLLLTYFVRLLGTLKAMRFGMKTGRASAGVSGYVGIMDILLGCLTLVTLPFARTYAVWSTIFTAGAYILFGIAILFFRERMMVYKALEKRELEINPSAGTPKAAEDAQAPASQTAV